MRLLLFNLATDTDDPILGFTTRWIDALAERVEFIHVITMRAGRVVVPDNVRVHSVGKEKGYSEPRRVVEFYKTLIRILYDDRVDICFSHMMPLFTVLAGLVLKATRIPIVTWYAHPSVTRTLKLAHYFSDRVVTSISTSYPYKHDKLIVIGHGIDGEIFSPAGLESSQRAAMILCVGRLSPVKDHPILLRAIKLLQERWRQPFRVVVIGGPGTSRDESYARSLQEQTRELGLEDTVRFEPPVALTHLPDWYRRCIVHVNLTPKGFVDKVALEAMACGTPSVVANIGFTETLGQYAEKLLFEFGNSDQLAQRLQWILSLSQSERTEIGKYLRQRVVSMHGVSRLAQRLVDIFEAVKFPKNQTYSAKARQEELTSR